MVQLAAVSSSWFETLVSRPEVIPLLGGFGVAIVVVIMGTWHRMEKTRANAELKRTMLDRGMSVEEIERVINAGSRER